MRSASLAKLNHCPSMWVGYSVGGDTVTHSAVSGYDELHFIHLLSTGLSETGVAVFGF